MVNYLARAMRQGTPQWEQADSRQVANSAGGYSFQLSIWQRLDRFLILGSEGGSYYATEQKLTKDNAQAVQACLKENGIRTIQRVLEVSEGGLAPKNDPALFVLALAACDQSTVTKQAAFAALPGIARTGTHLFQFVEMVTSMRGWGRSLRKGIADWYERTRDDRLAYQVIKYRQRGGWSHDDLLRLSHPSGDGPGEHKAIYHWITKGWESVGEEPHPTPALRQIWAHERVKRESDPGIVAEYIERYRLPREAVPTEMLQYPVVWNALAKDMPMLALVRNLATLTRVGLIGPHASESTAMIEAQLYDKAKIIGSKIHPIQVLAALVTYQGGKGVRGKQAWNPDKRITNALDQMFYTSFGNVPATGKKIQLALDVSGSMDSGEVAGVPGLTPRIACAAMALVTMAVEPHVLPMAFSAEYVPLAWLSPGLRLDQVVERMRAIPFGRTDCSLPFKFALANKLHFDAFITFTDSETWAGFPHAHEALKTYRNATRDGQTAQTRSVVVGAVANEFSIADPADPLSLDVVGFSTETPTLISRFIAGEF